MSKHRNEVMAVAQAFAAKSDGRIEVAVYGESHNHFIQADGKRIGRDIEQYAFIGDAAGWANGLLLILEEVANRLEALGLEESYKAGSEKLRLFGLTVLEEEFHDVWNAVFEEESES